MTVLPQARASTLLVLVSLAGCLACASPGTPRFLADSQPLTDGHHVDKSWSNPALIASSHVAVIELAEVMVSEMLRGIGTDLVRELDELFQAASNTVRKSAVTDGAQP